MLLPYTWVSLGLDFTQIVLAVGKHLDMAIMIILNNLEQPILMQFFQKFTLWGSPCSCPTPWCLWGWTSPRWSWMSGKTFKPTQFYMLNNLCFNNFSKKSIPGDVRAQVLQEPVGASHADQGRKSGMHHPFSDPGGQDESTGTPHLTLPSNPSLSQGG